MVFNTELFVESVRGYHVLWNSGSGDYKDRNVKANAWEAVANENSCTVEEIFHTRHVTFEF